LETVTVLIYQRKNKIQTNATPDELGNNTGQAQMLYKAKD